eukprot:CAMPEP_0113964014 /NCGR_PEP_ID=MMETSP0011_2-20120614/6861_1 /TAXON_ID=101924 /ORGANISM="Rhodosorus marinus" /LENGTH=375 /DNA_ID=CAMNT_0000976183 /DNA_START=26 /DNA_END=1153 /DNA_ORIENTATION=+ /assembly_acc=CAM_ASM_000156
MAYAEGFEAALGKMIGEIEMVWVKGPLVVPSFFGGCQLSGIDARGMRLLCVGSVVGLAQAVLLPTVGVVRKGVWLKTDEPMLPDVSVLEEKDRSSKKDLMASSVVGSSVTASSVTTSGMHHGKASDGCSWSEAEVSNCDMSASEVTADSDSGYDQDDDIEKTIDLLRVDIGKVEALSLVIQSTKAVDIGRVLCFESFSEAAKNTLYVVDALLMDMRKAHQFVSGDIVNNLRKVSRAVASTNTNCIEDMVLNELQMDVKYKNSGREALLWLKRALVFIYTSTKYIVERPHHALVKNAKDAYNEKMAACHGFKAHAVRFMMNGVPERSVFLSRLGSDEKQVIEDLGIWVESLRPILEHLCNFCTKNNLERIAKIQEL